MRDYSVENPIFSDKISIVEEDDLVSAENDTAASKQLLQNDLVLLARMDKYLGSDDNTEGPEFAEGIQSEDVIGAINEVFQLGSEKKKQLVENLAALGITASTSETWEMLLDKVLNLINTSNDTVTAETLLSGYTAHNAAGAKITGTLADKTSTIDHSASASLDTTNKWLKLKVPATGKYGVGNYLYAAYTTIANLIGLTTAKLVKGNTILGITGNNNNMDTSGADAVAGDILSGKKAGVKGSLIVGTMPNKGAWTGATTGSGNVTIPAGYHNGQGHVSGAGAYNAGVSAADGRVNADSANYRGGYNAGVSATKKGTAGAGDVLAGKTFTNGSSVEASGTMANKGSTTQDATATQDDTYTYLTVPVSGYYNTESKLRTKNSDLVFDGKIPSGMYLAVTGGTSFTLISRGVPEDIIPHLKFVGGYVSGFSGRNELSQRDDYRHYGAKVSYADGKVTSSPSDAYIASMGTKGGTGSGWTRFTSVCAVFQYV
ncbi:hypothetical protein IMSAGC011_02346 [Lachnospiraceae bacterium]|nr:hypothetical protein IMSAGC011_02346 [Lachnospiraceae bacterium]